MAVKGNRQSPEGTLGTGVPRFCQNVPGAAGAAAGAADAAAAGAAAATSRLLFSLPRTW